MIGPVVHRASWSNSEMASPRPAPTIGRNPPEGQGLRPPAVDPAQQLVVVPGRVLVQADDVRAPVRLDQHPAFPVQGDDCFADRDAADAEFRGDRRSAISVPRFPVTLTGTPNGGIVTAMV